MFFKNKTKPKQSAPFLKLDCDWILKISAEL